jgi:hypothetical protein
MHVHNKLQWFRQLVKVRAGDQREAGRWPIAALPKKPLNPKGRVSRRKWKGGGSDVGGKQGLPGCGQDSTAAHDAPDPHITISWLKLHQRAASIERQQPH